MGEKEDTKIIKAISRDEEGKKKIEKAEVHVHKPETLKYVERKLVDKGVARMERHPVDGLGLVHQPKSGRGGKYTWEGPGDPAESELEAAPAAIDERDPNYVDEEEEERIVKGEDSEVGGLVVGVAEVAKVVEDKVGVARVEIRPPL